MKFTEASHMYKFVIYECKYEDTNWTPEVNENYHVQETKHAIYFFLVGEKNTCVISCCAPFQSICFAIQAPFLIGATWKRCFWPLLLRREKLCLAKYARCQSTHALRSMGQKLSIDRPEKKTKTATGVNRVFREPNIPAQQKQIQFIR